MALPEQVRNSVGWIWEFIYPAGFKHWEHMGILYVLVPWIGVMAAGYGFGLIMIRQPAERQRLCLIIGASATLLFLLAGGLILVLDPKHGDIAFLGFFFNCSIQKKYPASQIFLLMTLGPMIAALALAERANGWFAGVLATFGRVPMFYYLLHIPAIHLAALAIMLLREGSVHPEWYVTAPFTWMPPEHRWGLPLLYLVFGVVVAALYFACRWYAGVKRRHPQSWLRYI